MLQPHIGGRNRTVEAVVVFDSGYLGNADNEVRL